LFTAAAARGSWTAEETAALPSLVRTFVATPAFQHDAATTLALLDALGGYAVLTEIATRDDLAWGLRVAAATTGLRNAGERPQDQLERSVAPAAALLGDLTAPTSVLRDVIAGIPHEAVESGRLLGALVSLESSHPHAWVRADALALLSATGHAPAGDLRILSAIYGMDGKDVDVADVLRGAVAAGHLRVVASNALAGDPNVGIVKVLRVEYVHGGRRRVKQVREGQELILP
jgi:hypothetical protein